MSTKHVFESTDGLVFAGLRGAVAVNPAVRLHAPHKVVYLDSPPKDQVSIISGGGAGHEPAHALYVGKGMLTAAVSGDIFASPSASQILSAVSLVPSDKGVLFIVNQYTGDKLNFGLAAERARARDIQVETVIVGDDVSVGRLRGGLVGRRGLAGNPLVCKILGAASAREMPLPLLSALGRAVTSNLATIAASLDHCHVPGRDKSADARGALGDSECEIGMGLHNEPGVRKVWRVKEELGGARELVREMLRYLLDEGDKDRAFVRFERGEEETGPLLMINNLGGLSVLELSAIVSETLSQLEHEHHIFPSRVFSGTYMTSLNAPGFSITLLNVSAAAVSFSTSHTPSPITPSQSPTAAASAGTSTPVAQSAVEDILRLVDAPTDALGWTGVSGGWTRPPRAREEEQTAAEERTRGMAEVDSDAGEGMRSKSMDADIVQRALRSACEAVLEAGPELTSMDTVYGDGDCGETLAAGAKAIQSAWSTIPFSRAAPTVSRISHIVESAMGGTSGALYALFLSSLSTSLRTYTHPQSAADWSRAASDALSALSQYTPARPGDRTLIDALVPFCSALEDGKGLDPAVEAAWVGAEATRGMRPKLGRATYVGHEGEVEDREKVPDPGAWAVAVLVQGLRDGMRGDGDGSVGI